MAKTAEQVVQNSDSRRNYRICPRCGCGLRADRFEKHMRKQHSPCAEKARELARQKLAITKELKELEGNQTVRCNICGTKVKLKNKGRHFKKVHDTFGNYCQNPVSTTPESGSLRSLSSRDRIRALNRRFGPDREYSEDLFDRGRVVQGGGYGLGNNRHH